MKTHHWEKMTAEKLEAEVRRHNRLYFVEHRPKISDAEFDRLVERLRFVKPHSEVLSELISDVSSTEKKKVRHQTPMLSLDKCYDETQVMEWAGNFEGDVIASPKIDGCAVSLRYDGKGRLVLAATRGNGIEGENITANIRFINGVSQQMQLSNIEVRGEVFMPLSIFQEYRKQFSNPRNLAAGAMKQKDPKKTGKYRLSFLAYDLLGTGAKSEVEKRKLLRQHGFPVVEWTAVKTNEIQKVFEDFLKRRGDIDFETDGVVYRVDRIDEQERLGSTAHHPRFAIAYKFQGDSGVTRLLDVEWSVSRTGVITPVGIVEPVELSGALVQRASLHNVGMLRKLALSRGARVLMMRRGGVIPNLESVVEPGKERIPIPSVCPSCGAPTKLEDDFLYCTRPKTCLRSKVGELSHYVKTIELDGFGEKLLFHLYESGLVTDPAEFYQLTTNDLLQIERMGERLAHKLLRNIEQRRRLPLNLFLQSLGIRELGKHVARILAKYGSLKKILKLEEEDLSSVHTVGPVIAHEVVAGLKMKQKLIEKLLKKIEIIEPPTDVSQTGPLAGKSVLFTGTLVSMERRQAQRLVEEKGGTAASSVSRDLDFLVVGSGGGGGVKLKKVKQLEEKGGKTQLLSEQDFLSLIT